MDNNSRPTFGATAPSNGETKTRNDVGAIWERESRNNPGLKYLSIKLNLTKAQLLQLAQSGGDTVSVNLVAFTNKNKGDNPSRPSYRIFEDKPKNPA